VTDTKRRAKRRKGIGRNYLIVRPKGGITVVSGKTGEITTLSKAQADRVLDLVRARQQLGNDITNLLKKLGVIVAPAGTVNIEEE